MNSKIRGASGCPKAPGGSILSRAMLMSDTTVINCGKPGILGGQGQRAQNLKRGKNPKP